MVVNGNRAAAPDFNLLDGQRGLDGVVARPARHRARKMINKLLLTIKNHARTDVLIIV